MKKEILLSGVKNIKVTKENGHTIMYSVKEGYLCKYNDWYAQNKGVIFFEKEEDAITFGEKICQGEIKSSGNRWFKMPEKAEVVLEITSEDYKGDYKNVTYEVVSKEKEDEAIESDEEGTYSLEDESWEDSFKRRGSHGIKFERGEGFSKTKSSYEAIDCFDSEEELEAEIETMDALYDKYRALMDEDPCIYPEDAWNKVFQSTGLTYDKV